MTSEQLKDYLYCPMYYQYRHIEKLSTPPHTIMSSYEFGVRRVMFWMFTQIQNGQTPELKEMLRRFGVYWLEEEDPKSLKIYRERKQNEDRRLSGLSTIERIFRYFEKKPGTPILINKRYTVPVSGIDVTGNYDLIRELQWEHRHETQLEIVSIQNRVGNLSSDLLKYDLDLLLSVHAFREQFQQEEDRSLAVIINEKSHPKKVKIEDYNLEHLKVMVETVAENIDKKRFYIMPNRNCKICPFIRECKSKTKGAI